MAFRKDVIIYERGKIKIYINQCYNPKKKTWLYAIRRDDAKGLAHYLGTIEWSGAWRQYVFCPEPLTKWSAACNQGITDFCIEITQIQRKKWRKK